MFMTAAGFVILLLLILLGIWLVVELAGLPGNKAREREHPQAEAISVLGWLGLVFGGVGWIAAMVWAYTRPVTVQVQTLPAGDQPAESGPGATPAEPALGSE